ncbi:armadillo repeat containing 12 [Chelydra serpentina]|uniref:Armadillo repeat containing 12 n=1 Tax=Chelydra serpentina TaxID=8475 RepID=A0A8T1T294_CHESE|nr:armadillo repeat containing 12 [Chelydra serpentina]
MAGFKRQQQGSSPGHGGAQQLTAYSPHWQIDWKGSSAGFPPPPPPGTYMAPGPPVPTFMGTNNDSEGRCPFSTHVCVLLLQASACTYEDIRLVASALDDKDKGIKIQALNALKAFAGIRKFRIKIQVFAPLSASHSICLDSFGSNVTPQTFASGDDCIGPLPALIFLFEGNHVGVLL